MTEQEAAWKRARTASGLQAEWASLNRLLEAAIAGGMDPQLLLNFYEGVRQLATGVKVLEPVLRQPPAPTVELAVVMRVAKEVNAPKFLVRLSDLLPGWADDLGELPTPKDPDRIAIIDLTPTPGTIN
jgi:hypothetical protein